MDTINRQSKLPLYQQLYDVLRGNITRGEWKPGDLIPAESELIEQYGVSRITVRQVLDMLVQEGLIYRQRGRGSFVAHPTVEQVLQRLVSFTDDMRQRGFAPNTRIVLSGLLPAPEDIAGQLQVAAGRGARQDRARPPGRRRADERRGVVPGPSSSCRASCSRISSPIPCAKSSTANYNIRWERARQVIRAINATRAMAETLSVRAQRGAALHRTRVVFPAGRAGRVPARLSPRRPVRVAQ